MKRKRSTSVRGVCAGLALLALAACGGGAGDEAQQSFTIRVDGSSTVGPISKAVADSFNTTAPRGVQVTVAESGTGGGFAKFCKGETEIQGASRPIQASEMAACEAGGVSYIELPVAFDALTVVVHRDNPLSEISVEQLRKMWEPAAEGVVDNWRKVDSSFPDLPLRLYGADDKSGTFDYFTEVIVGEAKASRTDYSPSSNDNNIVTGVGGDEGALGYFGIAYYLANQDSLKALAIKETADSPAVLPSTETVLAGEYRPLARPLFIYVNAAALEKKPVEDFVNFYLTNGAKQARVTAYVPLPDAAYTLGLERVKARTVGTVFGGDADRSGSIEEVMAREATTTPVSAPAAPADPTATPAPATP